MNTQKQVFHIGIDARLWNETGVGRYIRNLVSYLQKIDTQNSYTLFVLSKDANHVASLLQNDKWSVKIADIHWHTLDEQIRFGKLLEKEKLDLVHFPYFSLPIQYKGMFILTIHDLILHQFPTGKASTKSRLVYWLKHTAYTYILSQAAKKAQKIITVSYATKHEIIKRLPVPEQKIVVTYEGVDKAISATGHIPPDIKKPYFLYVGNAYPHKNLDRLLTAFGKLVENNGEVALLLVGKEDYFYHRLMKQVQAMHLEQQILHLSHVSDEKLSGLYQHALALVMPSLMEGFGLPVLEAMANGCLVAVSHIPVFEEVAGSIPLYFNPSDTKSIQNVLESIANSEVENAKEKKQQGKTWTKKFSWEAMARQTWEAYQDCLGV